MSLVLFLLLLCGQLRDTTVQCSFYGYSYRTNNWYGGSTTNFYVFASDGDPLSYPIMVGYDEDWLDEWARGYVQFNVGFIPPGSIVQNAGVRFYVGFIGQWSDEWDGHACYVDLYGMENNLADWYPYSGYESSTLFYDAADGTIFTETPFYVSMDPQYNVYYPSDSTFLPLNSSFRSYLQGRVNQGINWVGLGIAKYNEEGSDAGVNFFGERTYLYVSFMLPNQPVLYDYQFYPEEGPPGSSFTFLVRYYDNYNNPPQYINLVIKRPDDIHDVYSLYLLQGESYDGLYGARIPIYPEGSYEVYFEGVNFNNVPIRYPSEGYLPGPQVIRDTIYLYNNFCNRDTISADSLIHFEVSYYSRFTSCDSVILVLYPLNDFGTGLTDTMRFSMDLLEGTALNGRYGVSVHLPPGAYVHYFKAYAGWSSLRFPADGYFSGPVILFAGVAENVSIKRNYAVYDVTGRFIKAISSENELKSLNLRSGVYFLAPLNKNLTKTKKILVVK